MKILAVIPARKSSKRIKRKNFRLIQGHPLIWYILKAADSASSISDIVVTSDDEEIIEYIKNCEDFNKKIFIRERPSELSGDDITLDPVVYDALLFMENLKGYKYDIVATLQPTSPNLKPTTLEKAISYFIKTSYDSCISVVEDKHLRWILKNNKLVPLYEKRVNRQWLPETYKETGAFLLSRREVVLPDSRLGKNVSVYPIEKEEAIDIDDETDWVLADALLSKLKIVMVVKGNRSVGMGHVYRVLTLSDIFFGNEIKVLALESDKEITKLISSHGYNVEPVDTIQEVLERIKEYSPDIVINDILDTEEAYIKNLKSSNAFVVNFEDLGSGSLHADLVFNALYEFSSPPPNHKYGPRYVCLRQEFLVTPPAPFRVYPETLLITFGGVDENNLTLRTLQIVPELIKENLIKNTIVILGPGYRHYKELRKFIKNSKLNNVKIFERVSNMALLMKKADIAVTSNGRTVYELASMGIPGIVIAQNDRETLHLFSRYSKGFKYLGIAPNVDSYKILEELKKILTNLELRKSMREEVLSFNLRVGVLRVKRIIIDEYWRWKYEKNDHWEKGC